MQCDYMLAQIWVVIPQDAMWLYVSSDMGCSPKIYIICFLAISDSVGVGIVWQGSHYN